jgi:hypothetical protein
VRQTLLVLFQVWISHLDELAHLITQLQKHRTELVVAFLTAMDGIDKHDADALREAVASEGCEAGVHNILFPLMDVETSGEILG